MASLPLFTTTEKDAGLWACPVTFEYVYHPYTGCIFPTMHGPWEIQEDPKIRKGQEMIRFDQEEKNRS